MNKKIKINFEPKHIIFIFIILILIIVNSIIYIRYTAPERKNIQSSKNATNIANSSQKNSNSKKEAKENGDIKTYLSYLTERDRMEYYCGQFIKYIKDGNYESAYNLLYPEFKANYFPTLEEFQKYMEEKFPKFFALEYDDISRQGDIYVLRLKIIDVLNNNSNEANMQDNIQRIVIQEKNYNDFVMSFQVKE